MIHNRGLDTDWSYEESVEHLQDSMLQDPTALSDFADDFFSTHHSHIQLETESILVVDSTTPAPFSSATSFVDSEFENDDDDLTVVDNEDEARIERLLNDLSTPLDSHEVNTRPVLKTEPDEAPPLLRTFRRLEFLSLPNVTQSEVRMRRTEDPRTGRLSLEVDHSTLSLPVHKVIADLFLNHILKLHVYSQRFERLVGGDVSSRQSVDKALRVALLGAGGCVLPSHIQHILKHKVNGNISVLSPPLVRIDAVEPDGEVLRAARDLFDAHFDERLEAHQTDGVSFLLEHNQRVREGGSSSTFSLRPYDVVVIDAFEPTNSASSSSGPQSRAPPKSLLDGADVVREALLSASPTQQSGVLIVNVFGDGQWLARTLQQYGPAHGFQRPFVVVIGHSEVTSENNYIVVTSPTASPRTPYNARSSGAGQQQNEATTVANKHLETGISRLEELTNSLLINGSHMYTGQVVNNGHIFAYNHPEEEDDGEQN